MTTTTESTRDVRIERLTLTAADGYQLAALRYSSPTPPRAHLVVGGATAVPQGFYKRFAEHAASTC
jgi:predicted alpha/beta hydrolase